MIGCVNGTAVTLDVRTVHLQSASGSQRSVDRQVRAIEKEKTGKFAAYYDRFRPLVIFLNGAVPDTAFGAIKEIPREAARATRPRLEWEQYRWAMKIVQRISIAAVKATALEAMRLPHQVRMFGYTAAATPRRQQHRAGAEERTAAGTTA